MFLLVALIPVVWMELFALALIHNVFVQEILVNIETAAVRVKQVRHIVGQLVIPNKKPVMLFVVQEWGAVRVRVLAVAFHQPDGGDQPKQQVVIRFQTIGRLVVRGGAR